MKKIVSDPKGAAKAGREGFDLTIQKMNPFRKPESEKFDNWADPRPNESKRRRKA